MKAKCITCKTIYQIWDGDEGECFDCVDKFTQNQLSLMQRTHFNNRKRLNIRKNITQSQREKLREIFRDNNHKFSLKTRFAEFCATQIDLSCAVIMRETKTFWSAK
jgi:hypothetical protein